MDREKLVRCATRRLRSKGPGPSYPGVLLIGCGGSGKSYLAKRISSEVARHIDGWAFALLGGEGRTQAEAYCWRPEERTDWQPLREIAGTGGSSASSEFLTTMFLALESRQWGLLATISEDAPPAILAVEVNDRYWSDSLSTVLTGWLDKNRPLLLTCRRQMLDQELPIKLEPREVPPLTQGEAESLVKSILGPLVVPDALPRVVERVLAFGGLHPGLLVEICRAFKNEHRLHSPSKRLTDEDSAVQSTLAVALTQQRVRETIEVIWSEMTDVERDCLMILTAAWQTGTSSIRMLNQAPLERFSFKTTETLEHWLDQTTQGLYEYFYIVTPGPPPRIEADLVTKFITEQDIYRMTWADDLPVLSKRFPAKLDMGLSIVIGSFMSSLLASFVFNQPELGTALLIVPLLTYLIYKIFIGDH